MMGLGMMIGAGVFLGMGISIGHAGPGGLVLTFALNGALAICTAMSFAELSSAIPRAGGVYNFARIAYGRPASFMAGWMEWFASAVVGSMYALTFSLYTLRYFENLGWLGFLYRITDTVPDSPAGDAVLWNFTKILAVSTALLFLYINFRGASETGKIGAIITLGQTIFVVVIGLVGVFITLRQPERLENFTPLMPLGWPPLLATMAFTYVAFEGYEVIAQAGDEAINPRKNLPKAMIYSVVIVTVIYILVAFATVVSISPNNPDINMPAWEWIGSFGEKGFGQAVAQLMPLGNFILTLAVIFSATSALNATIYSATRASYALGRDNMLPAAMAKIHSKRKTPYIALMVTGVIILTVAAFLPTRDVASSASFMFLLLFFLVNLSVIKIRRSMADELVYGFLMPLFPLFPVIGIVFQCVLTIELRHMSYIAWIVAPSWIVLGLLTYRFYSRKRAFSAEHEIQILEERKVKPASKYPVMVAVANPNSAALLVQDTYKICQAKEASVELIHMVPVPEQIPLSRAAEYISSGKESLLEAMLYLSMHFPCNTTLRYCRNIARGIVSAVREKNARLLVLGWHGKRETSLFSIGSTIDPIIEQAPCDIVVLKDTGKNKVFEKILVPVAGGPNSALAAEIASIVADGENPEITIMTVHTHNNRFDLEKFIQSQAKRLNLPEKTFIPKIVKAKSPVAAILKESKGYDLIVLGTSEKPYLFRLGSQTLPEKIACRTETPAMIVKRNIPIKSWIKRWV